MPTTTSDLPAIAAIPVKNIELPTLLLIFVSYSLCLALLLLGGTIPSVAWIIVAGLNITLFMSITHEVVHGHPTRYQWLNSLLILFPIAWTIPYERFRDTHMQHHETGQLTDPFDDPESWYLYRKMWLSRRPFTRAVLNFNNTLFGRMLIGPIIGLARFYFGEIRQVFVDPSSRQYMLLVWGKHLALCAIMVSFLSAVSQVPLWQWVCAAYFGHSALYVRTFLEHQAAPDHRQRTVIIRQKCPIAFLFLFNNFHMLHHDFPGIPWYRLPAAFKQTEEQYLSAKDAYVYQSYTEIFRRYFFRVKEPVAHPFLERDR